VNVHEMRLVHEVVRVRPATSTDSHGNTVYDYGVAASRTNMNAWLEQSSGTEPLSDGRAPLVGSWLMLTNDTDVTGRDRIEWNSLVFDVDGTPKVIYTPNSTEVHHIESTLRIVAG
jgi:hypothetical protein